MNKTQIYRPIRIFPDMNIIDFGVIDDCNYDSKSGTFIEKYKFYLLTSDKKYYIQDFDGNINRYEELDNCRICKDTFKCDNVQIFIDKNNKLKFYGELDDIMESVIDNSNLLSMEIKMFCTYKDNANFDISVLDFDNNLYIYSSNFDTPEYIGYRLKLGEVDIIHNNVRRIKKCES